MHLDPPPTRYCSEDPHIKHQHTRDKKQAQTVNEMTGRIY